MKRYTTEQKAPYGVYASLKPLDIISVNEDESVLKGKDGSSYVHIPTPLVIVLSPIVGGIYLLTFLIFPILALLSIAIKR